MDWKLQNIVGLFTFHYEKSKTLNMFLEFQQWVAEPAMFFDIRWISLGPLG